MARETHVTRLLDYLKKYGSITSLEAIRDLGNTRLSASIFVLKDNGHNIETENTQVATRWTNKDGSRKTTTVAKYTLNENN
tara:strand:- start:5574 stop:5816 length:243 start_codon:yes stop_codon:yes gene_type:complete